MDLNSKETWESEFEDDEFIREYTRNLMKKISRVIEYTDEEELIKLTYSEVMIVHFYHPSFKKCELMNTALEKISRNFPDIKFFKINVDKAPKMCKSLDISVLPFLGFFKNGFIVDFLVGFEKLGNGESFDFEMLTDYIKNSNIQN